MYTYACVRCAVPMSRVILYKLVYIMRNARELVFECRATKTIRNYTILYSPPGGRYYYIFMLENVTVV